MTNCDQPAKFSSVRAVCIGAGLLVVGAFWVVVQELLLGAGSLSTNSPPVGAVGLFVALMSIVLILQRLRALCGLGRKELLVIYCMLVTFFPLLSQGLWHRFVGMLVSVQTFSMYPVHVPAHMLPRGPELLRNPEFTQGRQEWEGNASPGEYRHGHIVSPCIVLRNTNADQIKEIRQWIPSQSEDGEDRIISDQWFAFTADLRAEDMVRGSSFSVAVSVDGQRWEELPYHVFRDTPAATVDGTGLLKMRMLGLEIPYGVRDGLWIRLRLKGQGDVQIVKLSLHSNEPIYQLVEGSDEISAEYRQQIDPNDRARLYYRPENSLSRWFYDLKSQIPWRAWSGPVASWGLLWIAMFLAMFALAAIVFRQWSDHEKLTFPLTIIPLALTEPDHEAGQYLPRILRSRPMWLGLITALIIYSLNGLHFYNSDVPHLPLHQDLSKLLTKAPWSALMGDGQGFAMNVILWGVGIAFFMDLQMAFNLWFFYLLCKLFLFVPHLQGKLDSKAWTGGPQYGHALWQFQGIGAAVAIALIALWLGRRHLVTVVRKALGYEPALDDSQEPLSYRGALSLLLISFVLLGIWGEIAGAGWLFGVLGMSVMLVFALMASRVRAECATPGAALVPAAPIVLMMAMGGLVTFGVFPMTYFLLAGGFMCAGYFLMLMPAMMETFQIAKMAQIGRGTMASALVVGFLVSVVAGGYVLLNWGYARGLSTMRGSVTVKDDWNSVLWRWRAENESGYNRLIRRLELSAQLETGKELTNAEKNKLHELNKVPQVQPLAWTAGFGALFTGALAILRLKFLTFPFHPLGYALATTQLISEFWFSILLAWGIRLGTLRLGGVRMIRNQVQPFMIGLIMGSVLAVLVWDAVGVYKIAYGYTGQVYVTW